VIPLPHRRTAEKDRALEALRQAYPEELALHGETLREIARIHGASDAEIDEAEQTPPTPPPLPT